MESFIVWAVAFMIAFAPPGRKTYIKDAEETVDQAKERYASVAKDLWSVVGEERPLFPGDHGRSRSAMLLLSMALKESGFRRDVDYGKGKYARGDGGRSWCFLQLNVGAGRTVAWNKKEGRFAKGDDNKDDVEPGYTGKELVEDRKKCFRAGYRVLQASLGACGGGDNGLRIYAAGSCDKAEDISRKRMRFFRKNLNRFGLGPENSAY